MATEGSPAQGSGTEGASRGGVSAERAAQRGREGRRGPGGIGPIAVPKASDVLAAELREKILDGVFVAGELLPTERDLVEMTQLSRATVREALRVLEIQGFIVTRPGRKGGSTARLPEVTEPSHALEMFVRGRGVRLKALLEARQAVEPLCAALAAERRTDAEVEELERLNVSMREHMDDDAFHLETNLRWHLAIARASHNELLEAFMHAISRILHSGTDIPGMKVNDVRVATASDHEKITEAIRRGDRDAALRRMERHVEAFAGKLRDLAARGEVKFN